MKTSGLGFNFEFNLFNKCRTLIDVELLETVLFDLCPSGGFLFVETLEFICIIFSLHCRST